MVTRLRRRFEAQTREYDAIAREYPHFRRNYLLGIVNGILYNSGLSFFNRTTIVPVFMQGLGAPSVLISLTSLFESLGWHLPQFFASKLIVHRSRKLPLYRAAAIVRLAGLCLAIVAALVATRTAPAIALLLFVLGFGLYSIAGGFAGIVFTELLAKTCPKEKRGSYFGWRQILSGITGFYLGVGVIRPIFAHMPYARNYMLAFGIGTALIAVSFFLFLQQKEPDQSSLPPRRTFRMQFTKARRILLVDHTFRRFVLYRALMMLWFAGVPFFMLFAKESLGARDAQIGFYISLEFAGSITANFLWGFISNRVGNRILLIVVCAMALLVSTAVILFGVGVLPAWAFGAIFFFGAAVDSGAGNGGINYALEIVPEGERPTYIGLMNTLLACALIVAALAATLRDLIGYTGLYAATGAVAIAALVMILRLPEPRRAVITRRVQRRPA